MDDSPHGRCRLVLCINIETAKSLSSNDISKLTAAGDIASVIFYGPTAEENEIEDAISDLVAPFQEAGVAVMVDHHSRIAGRTGADGLQLGQDPTALQDAMEKFSPKFLVGAGNVKTRHNALVIGELQPDYLMFGKPGGDIRPEPHPKNLDLGSWWSTMVEIPCIVLGGNALESAVDVAKCGADFVALDGAIFAPQNNDMTAEEGIQKVNQLLAAEAPRFETAHD